ncbi:restriction endonuclease S subunit [Ameyamaea chiangmaiensis NBRC 103196]|uniref:Restriction endonuclease subunit S n=1 Tax=Ameyamaea chiangmaiensis TaxID=442969 RepID=A0A850P6Z0_9PROT|nr:restriction endonuclease subunit S [Ameyamaea chiangmaiensis]MBS4076577.1 restriction endonuclease subunit S [Ameyamaea chiangmaiensis]NVN40395.1 restriction endonuclease subunit S [Ameyamaea chiangmaiensis]GBQ62196.1 restriction endonuclease S subunit [Ameyamaea chiangmaiensis NBRC 103196]
MPKGHARRSIGDLCDFFNGNGFRPPDWSPSGLPIIRIQNLNGSQNFNYFNGTPKPKWIVEPGDLLFAWAGVKGVSFGPTIWPGPRGVLNQHIFRVVPKKDIDKYWLYLALQVATRRIEANAHGFKSSLVHVQKDDITNQVVDLPPLHEQRKIAEVLRTWGESLEKLTALRAAHEDRLLGFRDSLMARASRRGQPVCFGDFLTESRIPGTDGATARKISVRLYGKGATEKIEPRRGSASTRYYRRAAGQIIWSKLDFLNGAFALVGSELDGCESTLDLPAFDCDPSVNPVWLIKYLTRPAYYTRQLHLARGQRKARRIAPDDWLASPLRLPDRATQDRIADALECARTELSLIDAEIEALTRQKRGLMQKLLTGEWRVNLEKELA